ncbi:MAG TPA: HNH endonuclease signature motif containing protein, partial [Actinomycetospora sp.]|nr:HNH endonuclease signature motif containing protein [Actinomycetospora sp.]
IRLRLTTALGLDHHPGTVPGYGAVLAQDARTMLLQRSDAEWRIVLTDDDGRLQHVLLARRRPRPPDPRGRRYRTRGRSAAIVELQVPTTLLAALIPRDHGEWAPLLVELQHRLAEIDGTAARPPDADAGSDEWARRRPGAELDRWIRVRDRHCVAPTCRRPAHQAELDHTLAHALGGPTSSWNLGAWCTHHHRAKHRAGWRVHQPVPGRFVIRTRAGLAHVTELRRVTEPLPEPLPAATGPRALPDDGWVDDHEEDIDPDWFRKAAPRKAATTARSERPAPAPPPAHPADDPPPF